MIDIFKELIEGLKIASSSQLGLIAYVALLLMVVLWVIKSKISQRGLLVISSFVVVVMFGLVAMSLQQRSSGAEKLVHIFSIDKRVTLARNLSSPIKTPVGTEYLQLIDTQIGSGGTRCRGPRIRNGQGLDFILCIDQGGRKVLLGDYEYLAETISIEENTATLRIMGPFSN